METLKSIGNTLISGIRNYPKSVLGGSAALALIGYGAAARAKTRTYVDVSTAEVVTTPSTNPGLRWTGRAMLAVGLSGMAAGAAMLLPRGVKWIKRAAPVVKAFGASTLLTVSSFGVLLATPAEGRNSPSVNRRRNLAACLTRAGVLCMAVTGAVWARPTVQAMVSKARPETIALAASSALTAVSALAVKTTKGHAFHLGIEPDYNDVNLPVADDLIRCRNEEIIKTFESTKEGRAYVSESVIAALTAEQANATAQYVRAKIAQSPWQWAHKFAKLLTGVGVLGVITSLAAMALKRRSTTPALVIDGAPTTPAVPLTTPSIPLTTPATPLTTPATPLTQPKRPRWAPRY